MFPWRRLTTSTKDKTSFHLLLLHDRQHDIFRASAYAELATPNAHA